MVFGVIIAISDFNQLQTAIGVHSMRCTAAPWCDPVAGTMVIAARELAGVQPLNISLVYVCQMCMWSTQCGCPCSRVQQGSQHQQHKVLLKQAPPCWQGTVPHAEVSNGKGKLRAVADSPSGVCAYCRTLCGGLAAPSWGPSSPTSCPSP